MQGETQPRIKKIAVMSDEAPSTTCSLALAGGAPRNDSGWPQQRRTAPQLRAKKSFVDCWHGQHCPWHAAGRCWFAHDGRVDVERPEKLENSKLRQQLGGLQKCIDELNEKLDRLLAEKSQPIPETEPALVPIPILVPVMIPVPIPVPVPISITDTGPEAQRAPWQPKCWRAARAVCGAALDRLTATASSIRNFSVEEDAAEKATEATPHVQRDLLAGAPEVFRLDEGDSRRERRAAVLLQRKADKLAKKEARRQLLCDHFSQDIAKERGPSLRGVT